MASQFLRVDSRLRAGDEERSLTLEQKPRRGPVHRRSRFGPHLLAHKLQDRIRVGVVFDTSLAANLDNGWGRPDFLRRARGSTEVIKGWRITLGTFRNGKQYASVTTKSIRR